MPAVLKKRKPARSWNGRRASAAAKKKDLLLVAALVAGLTKQLAVLLLGHTLAALLDY